MYRERFKKEIVKEDLKQLIGATIFERGSVYYQDNLVGRVKVIPSRAGNVKITAFVLGSDEYETGIIFNVKKASFEEFKCSCPFQWGECKHVAALGLKFIDLYVEFCRSDISEVGIMEYKKEFAQWIRNAKENNVQTWENPVYDDRESDGEYSEDGGAVKQLETAKEAMTPPENAKRGNVSCNVMSASLKERLKYIGIDAENIPDFVISELEKKFENNDITIGLQSKPKKERLEEELGERVLKKYCLVLKVNYYPTIELHEKNKPDASYWALEPEELLNREKDHLTQKQKELLVFLGRTKSHYYVAGVDWGILFKLIRDSELAIFLNKKSVKNRLQFNDQPLEIGAQLFAKKNTDYPDGGAMEQAEIAEIAFRLNGDLLEKKNIKIFPSVDALVALDDLQLSITPMSKILLGIVSRILVEVRSYDYGYQQDRYGQAYKWEASLFGEEIIRINEIIAGAARVFDFLFDKNFPTSKEASPIQCGL